MNPSLFVRGDKSVAQCDGHVALRVDYDIVEPLVRGFAWPLHYLDLGKDEQKRRLAERPQDPLKQWKSSPIDTVAIKRGKAYSEARDTMFVRTHAAIAPWRIVRADDKRLARLNLIRDILSRLHYAGKKDKLIQPDPNIAFEFSPESIKAWRLAS